MYHCIPHPHRLPHRRALWFEPPRLRHHRHCRHDDSLAVGPIHAGRHIGQHQGRCKCHILGSIPIEVHCLLLHHILFLSSLHALLLQALQRQRHTIHLCARVALPERSLVRAGRSRRTLWSLPRRPSTQPLHTTCIPFDEPHRVCWQRPLHTLLPHQCRHAGQPKEHVQPQRSHLCSSSHGDNCHPDQVVRSLGHPARTTHDSRRASHVVWA